jgi:hypothetical protein
MEIGIDIARTHCVDPNPLARHFLGQTDGEGVERAFGRGVVIYGSDDSGRAATDEVSGRILQVWKGQRLCKLMLGCQWNIRKERQKPEKF